MRTARSRSSSGYFPFCLGIAPSSQGLEPPRIPGRFTAAGSSGDAGWLSILASLLGGGVGTGTNADPIPCPICVPWPTADDVKVVLDRLREVGGFWGGVALDVGDLSTPAGAYDAVRGLFGASLNPLARATSSISDAISGDSNIRAAAARPSDPNTTADTDDDPKAKPAGPRFPTPPRTGTTDDDCATEDFTVYRFGKDSLTLDRLTADAAAAEGAGFPYGFSVSDRLPPNKAGDSLSARVSDLNRAGLCVEQTGNKKNHYTVHLDQPVTPAQVELLNQLFT